MATAEQVSELRSLTDVNDTDYPATVLSKYIDAAGINASAAAIWRQKAAKFAALVDVSESGSSRSMSQLYKNATAQASFFQELADRETEHEVQRTRVHTIERA